MKSRPRGIERKVAEHLSAAFKAFGMSPVERIPVLGRTGPDITINEARFVIDVKSRLAVPRSVYVPPGACLVRFDDGLIAFRLENILALLDGEITTYTQMPRMGTSKTVRDWYYHMRAWTTAHQPDGITMLVLHRSGVDGSRMPVGTASVVISHSDYSTLSLRRIT